MERRRIYWVWAEMIQRCTNQRNESYQNYGGRGIRVCERWRHSFDAFASDMGARPPGHTLERMDSNGDYSPQNCKWASRAEQNSNRRICIFVEIDGRRMTLKQAWREHAPKDLTYRALHKRVTKGADVMSALSEPVRVWPSKARVSTVQNDTTMRAA